MQTVPPGVYFGKRGIVEIEPGRIIKWSNYEKSDKLCSKYLLFQAPLPGNQLSACTIRNKDNATVIYQGDDTLLGPYISIDGGVPIFSDSTIASYFFKSNNENVFKDNFEIKPVKLIEFLNYCSQAAPFTDIVLNPTYHRAFQGYFFLNDSRWVLHTVSGVWDINEIEPRKLTDFNLPKGFLGAPDESVLAIHGINTQIQYPFKRVSGSDKSPFTPEDASDLVEEELSISMNQSTLMKTKFRLPIHFVSMLSIRFLVRDMHFLVRITHATIWVFSFSGYSGAISYISNTLLSG